MEIILALLKLALAIPVLAGLMLGVGAILNLLFDPAESDKPEFVERQAVPMGGGLWVLLLLFLLAAQFWAPLILPVDASLPAAHPLRLMQLGSALVLACLMLGLGTGKWPRALPLSFRRRPIMAYAVFLPTFAMVAIFNRILVEDVLGKEIPLQALGGIESLQGMPLLAAGLIIVVIVPWLEEILFRHYLWGALVNHPRFGIPRAVLFTSLAFAVLHPPAVWLPVFCLGILLAWVRWRSGRLAEAVLIHQLHNLVVLLLLSPGC